MVVNTEEQFITIGLCALATMLTRFLPFLCFSPDKPTPPFVRYLGNALPAGLHLWLRQMLVSITGGTLCYMGLIQFVLT